MTERPRERKSTTERRQALRSELIAAAEGLIASQGLDALAARAVAGEVGCSVGAIYNVFDDLDGLIIAVNSKTLAGLDREIGRILPSDQSDQDPEQTLVGIGHAYCRFAAKHPRLWSALFEQGLKPDRKVPDWHLDEHVRLFSHVVAVLKEILPERSDDEIWSLARLMFSAVHGIVSLGMHDLFIAVPSDEIEQQVETLVRAMVRGLFES